MMIVFIIFLLLIKYSVFAYVLYLIIMNQLKRLCCWNNDWYLYIYCFIRLGSQKWNLKTKISLQKKSFLTAIQQ